MQITPLSLTNPVAKKLTALQDFDNEYEKMVMTSPETYFRVFSYRGFDGPAFRSKLFSFVSNMGENYGYCDDKSIYHRRASLVMPKIKITKAPEQAKMFYHTHPKRDEPSLSSADDYLLYFDMSHKPRNIRHFYTVMADRMDYFHVVPKPSKKKDYVKIDEDKFIAGLDAQIDEAGKRLDETMSNETYADDLLYCEKVTREVVKWLNKTYGKYFTITYKCHYKVKKNPEEPTGSDLHLEDAFIAKALKDLKTGTASWPDFGPKDKPQENYAYWHSKYFTMNKDVKGVGYMGLLPGDDRRLTHFLYSNYRGSEYTYDDILGILCISNDIKIRDAKIRDGKEVPSRIVDILDYLEITNEEIREDIMLYDAVVAVDAYGSLSEVIGEEHNFILPIADFSIKSVEAMDEVRDGKKELNRAKYDIMIVLKEKMGKAVADALGKRNKELRNMRTPVAVHGQDGAAVSTVGVNPPVQRTRRDFGMVLPKRVFENPELLLELLEEYKKPDKDLQVGQTNAYNIAIPVENSAVSFTIQGTGNVQIFVPSKGYPMPEDSDEAVLQAVRTLVEKLNTFDFNIDTSDIAFGTIAPMRNPNAGTIIAITGLVSSTKNKFIDSLSKRMNASVVTTITTKTLKESEKRPNIVEVSDDIFTKMEINGELAVVTESLAGYKRGFSRRDMQKGDYMLVDARIQDLHFLINAKPSVISFFLHPTNTEAMIESYLSDSVSPQEAKRVAGMIDDTLDVAEGEVEHIIEYDIERPAAAIEEVYNIIPKPNPMPKPIGSMMVSSNGNYYLRVRNNPSTADRMEELINSIEAKARVLAAEEVDEKLNAGDYEEDAESLGMSSSEYAEKMKEGILNNPPVKLVSRVGTDDNVSRFFNKDTGKELTGKVFESGTIDTKDGVSLEVGEEMDPVELVGIKRQYNVAKLNDRAVIQVDNHTAQVFEKIDFKLPVHLEYDPMSLGEPSAFISTRGVLIFDKGEDNYTLVKRSEITDFKGVSKTDSTMLVPLYKYAKVVKRTPGKHGGPVENPQKKISIRIDESTNPEKKMMAVFTKPNGRTKTIHFGARGMSDYTQHKDKSRRKNYLARHGGMGEDWNDPMTAGALSRWILWGKPSLRESFNDFKKRFNLEGVMAVTNTRMNPNHIEISHYPDPDPEAEEGMMRIDLHEDGKNIGYLLWRESDDVINIQYLNVKGDYQKQGLGKLLLDELRKMHKGKKIQLHAPLGQHRDWIPEWYQRYGFELVEPDSNLMVLQNPRIPKMNPNHNPPWAVFIVGKVGDKYAATTRDDGRIGLPGGKVDAGESGKVAVMREATEEGWRFPKETNLTLIHQQDVEGKPIDWYMADTTPSKLSEYKEKHRGIKPILITEEELRNSGFGNENLPLHSKNPAFIVGQGGNTFDVRVVAPTRDPIMIESLRAATDKSFKHHKWYVKHHLDYVMAIMKRMPKVMGNWDKQMVDMVWMHDYPKMMGKGQDLSVVNDLLTTHRGEDYAYQVVHQLHLMERLKKSDWDSLTEYSMVAANLSTADALAHYYGPFFQIYIDENPDMSMEEIKKSNRQKLAKDKLKLRAGPMKDGLDSIKFQYKGRKVRILGNEQIKELIEKKNPMAPGYQSYSWTTEDWRSIKVNNKGEIDYKEKCGAEGTQTPDGSPRLCLPVEVIRSLLRTESGKDVIRTQARKKARAKKGERVPWHPRIKKIWKRVKEQSPKDNPPSKVIIVSGPSGSGKSTISKTIAKELGGTLVPTVTTRPRRPKEKEGEDRIFVSKDEFKEMINNNEFVEYKQHKDGVFYGRRKTDMDDISIVEVSLKGMKEYKELYPDSFAVFLEPDKSPKEIEKRLLSRGGMSEANAKARASIIPKQVEAAKTMPYDLFVKSRTGKYSEVAKEIISQIPIANPGWRHGEAMDEEDDPFADQFEA
jgi:guanylate kinase